MKKILASYRLSIVFSLLIFSLGLLNVLLNSISASLEQTSMDILRQEAKYRTSDITNSSQKLEKLMETVSPPYMEKQEAKRFLAETAEHIKTLYGGKYSDSIKDENSRLSIDMEFSVTPASPGDISAIVDYFSASVSPVYNIRTMSFTSGKKGKEVSFKITLTQPYVGGTYVF
ncbi:MAG: hypothetical protein AB7E96_06610 [Deferribacterales bacterium]